MDIFKKGNEKYISNSKLIDEMIEKVNSIEISSKYRLFKLNLIEKVLDKYGINDDSIFIDDWLEIVENEIVLRNESGSMRRNSLINDEKKYDMLVESCKTRRNSCRRISITESDKSLGELTPNEVEEHFKWEESLDLIDIKNKI
jgi:hypothetical protein